MDAAGPSAPDAPGSEAPPAEDETSPTQLKAMGNEAYQRDDVQAAVDLWNRALKKHVEGMVPGASANGLSPFSPESTLLERSLYLNLAQGYLRLGDPARALRACQVVIREYPGDAKAKYRAAEACLALGKFDEALSWLGQLQEQGDEAVGPEVARLQLRVRAAEKEEVRRQKEVARRMCAAAAGFSDGRTPSEASASRRAEIESRLPNMNPGSLAVACDVADAAAQAARARDARLAAAGTAPLPEPAVMDLDAFRAKVVAKTSKYSAFMDKSRKKTQEAQRSVRLDWLRSGQADGGFEGFAQPLREELREIEVRAEETLRQQAEAEAQAGEPEGDPEAEAPVHRVAIDEMD